MTNHPSNEQIAEMMRQLSEARIANWLDDKIGSWRWWVLVGVLIMPWFIWYKLVDKKKLPEISLFGLVVMVFTITLDEFGFAACLWNYPIEVIPIFPRLTSADYTVVPVVYMLLYQYFPTWKSFFWGLITISTVFSFIAEPLLVYFGFYIIIKWLFWYSFIIYIVMGLLSRWIARKIFDIASNR